MNDLIRRQDAIAAADRADCTELAVEDVKKVTDEVIKELKQLPSAKSDRSNNVTSEINYCKFDWDNLISIRHAIEALEKEKPTPFINKDGSKDPFGMGRQNQWYRDGIAIMNLPHARPKISRIEQELHGKTPEEQYEFLHWLLLKFGLAYTDSRFAVVEWLRGEKEDGRFNQQTSGD